MMMNCNDTLLINLNCFKKCGASAAIVLAYIYRHSVDNVLQLSLEDLAAEIGFTYQHICRIIKILEYENYLRIFSVKSGKYYRREIIIREHTYDNQK